MTVAGALIPVAVVTGITVIPSPEDPLVEAGLLPTLTPEDKGEIVGARLVSLAIDSLVAVLAEPRDGVTVIATVVDDCSVMVVVGESELSLVASGLTVGWFNGWLLVAVSKVAGEVATSVVYPPTGPVNVGDSVTNTIVTGDGWVASVKLAVVAMTSVVEVSNEVVTGGLPVVFSLVSVEVLTTLTESLVEESVGVDPSTVVCMVVNRVVDS